MPGDESSPQPANTSGGDEPPRIPPFVKEVARTTAIVILVGLVLFTVTGVWPPMVAVQSGSMEPNMYRTDLIIVMSTDRGAPDAAQPGTGVVTARAGERVDYQKQGGYGDVIVYQANGDPSRPQIIHRAMFWVEEGENWYDKANKSHVQGESCDVILNCPAPHSGFITKGDANPYYDQSSGISQPVKPEWVRATAEVRIPYLGWVRLAATGQ